MASSDGLIIAAGTVSFIGNMKEASGFPPNGVTIIGATAALAIVAALTKGTPVEQPFVAFAALALLAAVYRYVPAFRNIKKGKNNG